MTYTHQVVDYKHGPAAKALIAQGWAIHVVETYSSKNFTDLLIRFTPACKSIDGALEELNLARRETTVRVRQGEAEIPSKAVKGRFEGFALSNDHAVEHACRRFAADIRNKLRAYIDHLNTLRDSIYFEEEQS